MAKASGPAMLDTLVPVCTQKLSMFGWETSWELLIVLLAWGIWMLLRCNIVSPSTGAAAISSGKESLSNLVDTAVAQVIEHEDPSSNPAGNLFCPLKPLENLKQVRNLP